MTTQERSTQSLSDGARDNLWMHFTRHSVYENGGEVPIITRGEGAYVFDSRGKKYLDGFSGLWCVAIGHNNPKVIEAVNKQMKKISCFTSFT